MRKFRMRSFALLLSVFALVGGACANNSGSSSSGGNTGATGATGTSGSTGAVGVCASVDASGTDALSKLCSSGELRIATDSKYKPQSWFDTKTNTWKGFDVDVATEIAKRLGVTPAFQYQTWAVVTAGSWSDRWDISVGSMTDTTDREKLFYFPPPYYFTPAGMAVNATNTTYTTPSDLSGKTVCVGEKTTYESYLEGTLHLGATAPAFNYQVTGAKVFTTTTDTDALDQLSLGDGVRCDAAISAVPTIAQYIKDQGSLKLLGDPLFYEPLCVALDKNSPVDQQALVDAVSKVIQDMHNDGTLTALSLKYYGVDLTSTINTSTSS